MEWFEKMKESVHDEQNIKGFFGQYRWLSNFEPCLIEYEGYVFHSSEAAYQAAKTNDFKEKQKFFNATASQSKKLGRNISLRFDWEQVKLSVMEDILTAKFNKNADLRERLINTNKKYLEETNWWNDRFWGVCNGHGENNLGKILMKIRNNLTVNATTN